MSKILVGLLAAAALTASSAWAQAPAAPTASALVPTVGQVVRDVNGRRIGAIDQVQGGVVLVISDMRMLRIPISTLTTGDKGLQTSLTRAALR
jgi:hypothetical protein